MRFLILSGKTDLYAKWPFGIWNSCRKAEAKTRGVEFRAGAGTGWWAVGLGARGKTVVFSRMSLNSGSISWLHILGTTIPALQN
jgi:hypothetical protein